MRRIYADRVGGLDVGVQHPQSLPRLRFDRRELAGAVADIGVLVPIAVALIVQNGLSATAVLLPAAVLYVFVGAYYRVPISVQPLKAFGALAIAHRLGVPEIAAGALIMGVVFVTLGVTGLLDRVARLFPQAVVRGVQLSVGLLFVSLAVSMVISPPDGFDPAASTAVLGVTALGLALLTLVFRARGITLLLVAVAAVICVLGYEGPWQLGPSPLAIPSLSLDAFVTAAVVLVLPQVPLTFANSCLAASDVARTYYGPDAARVGVGRLATSLGSANLFAAGIGGMPVCHGAGGITAHRAFGARTGGAPLVMGAALLVLALLLGATLAPLLGGFPIPLLAALLGVAGLLHIALLADVRGGRDWLIALGIGLAGLLGYLAVALVVGTALWWLMNGTRDGSR